MKMVCKDLQDFFDLFRKLSKITGQNNFVVGRNFFYCSFYNLNTDEGDAYDLIDLNTFDSVEINQTIEFSNLGEHLAFIPNGIKTTLEKVASEVQGENIRRMTSLFVVYVTGYYSKETQEMLLNNISKVDFEFYYDILEDLGEKRRVNRHVVSFTVKKE